MPLSKSVYQTSLTAAKMTALLKKLKEMYPGKKNCIVVQHGDVRYLGEKLVSLTIDETQSAGALIFEAAVGVIAALKAIQDLTYTAQAKGTDGNDITITYVDPAGAGALSVGVVGTDITVNLEHDGVSVVSTADEIKDAIENEAAAAALVSVAVSGTGSNVQAAQVQTALEDGSNTATFDKADILEIQRLRSRKWKVILKVASNPAA